VKHQGDDDYLINEELLSNGDHNGILKGRIRIAGQLEDIDRSLGNLAHDEASMVKLDDISTIRETRLSQIASIGKDRDRSRESRSRSSDRGSDRGSDNGRGGENDRDRDDEKLVGGSCCIVA
jgi:hypothetical protein